MNPADKSTCRAKGISKLTKLPQERRWISQPRAGLDYLTTSKSASSQLQCQLPSEDILLGDVLDVDGLNATQSVSNPARAT